MTGDLLPILHIIDLKFGIEMGCADKRERRLRNRKRGLMAAATRRDRDAALRKAVGFEAEGQQPGHRPNPSQNRAPQIKRRGT